MEYDISTISAALAIGLTAAATSYAQAKIGTAAVAALTEKRDLIGGLIILIAIPETMVILGFVIAYLIVT